ncbi:15-hydroxyprostaglandin dehydrogenase [Patellaria atrata CBS 101060]|uniref:15-hydroxyprostaglandin dehydrogenase n=1 Tax=Patellaria atrata CBS 101060 TaxID=1346257 RepID=A0A9P4S9R8_9PEZI|nr:15-hydroxyprostaglandin dehydrogenase [Patellaria atrata CBS 101060]
MPSERVAIVTGASSGMGLALSRDLVNRGWKVAMADINPNVELSKELGDKAEFFKCNVADYDSQAEMFQKAWDKFGRIDALCANAGIVDRSSVYILDHRGSNKIPPKPDLSCTDIDYKGVVYGTQLAIHFMRKNKTPGGKIVATVLNFIRAVSRVLKIKENITTHAVLPGIVHTNIIPQAMIDAVSSEALTPVSSIVSAYNRFLDGDDSLNGEALECAADKQMFVPRPEYLNGGISKRACTVWDPLFKMYHHELSELPDAIP